MNKIDLDRFWSKVNKQASNGCWEWTAALNKGYGVFRLDNKTISAHRLSYALLNKPISSDIFICHKCDNTKCVNPDHFFLGDAKDNHQDMMGKNRHAKGDKVANKGSAHPQSTLTEEMVLEIRRLRKDFGTKGKELALIYGVRETTISSIVKRKAWKHI